MQKVKDESSLSRTKQGIIINSDNNQYNARKVIKMQSNQISSLEKRITLIEELLKGRF